MTDLVLDPRILARRKCEFCDGTGEIKHDDNTTVLCMCIEDRRLREILRRDIKAKRAAFEQEQEKRRLIRNRIAWTVAAGALVLLAAWVSR
jgi:hypothetical protein